MKVLDDRSEGDDGDDNTKDEALRHWETNKTSSHISEDEIEARKKAEREGKKYVSSSGSSLSGHNSSGSGLDEYGMTTVDKTKKGNAKGWSKGEKGKWRSKGRKGDGQDSSSEPEEIWEQKELQAQFEAKKQEEKRKKTLAKKKAAEEKHRKLQET